MGCPGGSVIKTPPWMMEIWVGKTSWRRAWQPTPVFLRGKSHGQRSLAGYGSWGRKEWDMTKATQVSSVAQSCLTLCDPMDCSMPRLPCPSPTPTVYSNPCPLSRWCHPTISSSVVAFSSRLQSFPASGCFQMSQFSSGGQSIGVSASASGGQSIGVSASASGGQSIGVSASASVLLVNIQDWFPLGCL